MTLKQIAALLFRVFGVYLFFDAAVVLTTLPTEIFNIHTSQVDYIVSEHEFLLAMSLVRLFVYSAGGICFLVFARPLAKLFTKGLDKHD
jgi:hypothetical protein